MSNTQLISFILLWIVIAAEGILLFLLYRHVGFIYGQQVQNLNGLIKGTQAPSLIAKNLKGKTISLEELLTGNTTFLVFGSSHCSSCRDLLVDPKIERFLETRSIPGYFLVNETESKNGDFTKQYLEQPERPLKILMTTEEAFQNYLIPAMPFAYIVNQKGTILAGGTVGGGVKEFEGLYESVK